VALSRLKDPLQVHVQIRLCHSRVQQRAVVRGCCADVLMCLCCLVASCAHLHPVFMQGLKAPITEIWRLRSSDQRLYLQTADAPAGSCVVLGGLKVGKKKLFLHRVCMHAHAAPSAAVTCDMHVAVFCAQPRSAACLAVGSGSATASKTASLRAAMTVYLCWPGHSWS
jgi:hypothetical protein